MSIRITVDLYGADRRIRRLGSEGQSKLARMIIRDSTPYVPRDTGELRDSAQIQGKAIVWSAPHAKSVYSTPRNYKTPGTTHHWIDKAKGIHSKDWVKELGRGF